MGALAGFSGSFLNTFLVLGAIVLFKQEVYMTIKGVDQTGLWQLLGGIIATNGIVEAFVAAILTPIFYQVTLQLAKRQGQH